MSNCYQLDKPRGGNCSTTSGKIDLDLYRNALSVRDACERLGISVNGSEFISCPNHSESHASAKLYPEHIHCFGCGFNANLIGIVRHIKGLGFWEAVNWIANEAGLPHVQGRDWTPEQRAEFERRQAEAERTFECLTKLADYYHEQLVSNPQALEAFQAQYKISRATIDLLKIGFANGAVIACLRENGFSLDEIKATGAFVVDKNGRPCAFFKKRFVFPYWFRGTVRYMIGRRTQWTEDNQFEKAKYKKLLTWSEKRPYVSSAIDNSVFYGEDALSVRPASIVITEGVTDCISATQAGFDSISPVTTRIKRADFERILPKLKSVKIVYLVNDNEISGMGEAGAIDSAEVLFKAGIDVRIVTLPLGEKQEKARQEISKRFGITVEMSPGDILAAKQALSGDDDEDYEMLAKDAKTDLNEYFHDHTAADFRALQKQAREFLDVMLDTVPAGGSPRERYRVLAPIMKIISEQPELTWKDHIEAVCKRFSHLDTGALRKEVAHHRKENEAEKEASSKFLPKAYSNRIMESVPVMHYLGGFYHYRGGVYRSWYRQEVDKLIMDMLGENVQPYQVDQIRSILEIDTFKRPELVNLPGLLNIANGLLNVKTGELAPHTPGVLSTAQSSVTFDPAVTCHTWMTFLDRVLPDPDQRMLLAEIFGYCLTTEIGKHKAFILLGEGANGKGVVLDVLRALVG